MTISALRNRIKRLETKVKKSDTLLDICGRDDLFLAVHLILREKLDICGPDDLFLVFT